jgi:hypothetical protein
LEANRKDTETGGYGNPSTILRTYGADAAKQDSWQEAACSRQEDQFIVHGFKFKTIRNKPYRQIMAYCGTYFHNNKKIIS